ncbi:MAG: ferric reductase-like transmembrane domain-containing protein [Coriobacteriia bacterium]|nr:ferric reductase-like transmembrane domain-containing protein [Coriobacteriia bacterium]
MNTLIVIALTILVIVLLHKQIKQHPYVFYGLACAMFVAFVLGQLFYLPKAVNVFFMTPMRRATIAMGIFFVVMYAGLFTKPSRAKRLLKPMRKELSIIAGILAFAHVYAYNFNYFTRIFVDKLNPLISFKLALFTGVILTILLILLWLTSFNFIKRKMTRQRWKAIQKWSYLFYALIFVHVLAILMQPALSGGREAQITIALYSLIFIIYFVARIAVYKRDKREHIEEDDAYAKDLEKGFI